MNSESQHQASVLELERETAPSMEESAPPLALMDQLRELREVVSTYAAARTDSIRLAVREILLSLFLTAITFVSVSAAIVFAIWFFLRGASMAFDQLLGGPSWVGPAATGALALMGIVLGLHFTIARRKNASRESIVHKYETRLARQSADFGRDIHGDKK